MLGIFPDTFPQAATSQGHFPKWKLYNCAISQAATFQVCPCHTHSIRPSSLFQPQRWPPSPSQLQRSAPHCSLQRLIRSNLTFGKLPCTWEIAKLGNCHQGSCHLRIELDIVFFWSTIICYQFTCYLFHLLSASVALRPHLLSPHLLSSLTLAIRSICYQASLAIKTFALQSQLLLMLICYPKLVTIKIRCYQNQLFSK